MINGFEIETAILNDKEIEIMNLMIPHLKRKVGEENAVTNSTMSKGLKRVFDVKVGDARIRKIINHIRLTGKIKRLVATSKGYYIEKDDKKLNTYIESLHQRASAILAVAKQLELQKNQ